MLRRDYLKQIFGIVTFHQATQLIVKFLDGPESGLQKFSLASFWIQGRGCLQIYIDKSLSTLVALRCAGFCIEFYGWPRGDWGARILTTIRFKQTEQNRLVATTRPPYSLATGILILPKSRPLQQPKQVSSNGKLADAWRIPLQFVKRAFIADRSMKELTVYLTCKTPVPSLIAPVNSSSCLRVSFQLAWVL